MLGCLEDFFFSFLFHPGVNIMRAEATPMYSSAKIMTSYSGTVLLLVDSHQMLATDDDNRSICGLGQTLICGKCPLIWLGPF